MYRNMLKCNCTLLVEAKTIYKMRGTHMKPGKESVLEHTHKWEMGF